MHFRTKGILGYALSSSPVAEEGTITIDNDATWQFSIAPMVLPLDVDEWDWDFEITDVAGGVLTPYKGILEITKDQSHG